MSKDQLRSASKALAPLLRRRGTSPAVGSSLRRAVQALDKALAVHDVQAAPLAVRQALAELRACLARGLALVGETRHATALTSLAARTEDPVRLGVLLMAATTLGSVNAFTQTRARLRARESTTQAMLDALALAGAPSDAVLLTELAVDEAVGEAVARKTGAASLLLAAATLGHPATLAALPRLADHVPADVLAEAQRRIAGGAEPDISSAKGRRLFRGKPWSVAKLIEAVADPAESVSAQRLLALELRAHRHRTAIGGAKPRVRRRAIHDRRRLDEARREDRRSPRHRRVVLPGQAAPVGVASMIGEVVGTYRLTEKIGEGSMGEVFVGEHTQAAQKAAVKVFFPTFSKRSIGLSRYFAEVRSTNALNHDGIATIYDCGTHTSGRAYVCMERLSGRSLAEALADLPDGDTSTVAGIGVQVAAVLDVVHAHKMVHRGLKPDSIFLLDSPQPMVKLLDFGAANFGQGVRQSQTGSLLGAPLYMSPEVGRGLGSVDHRADVYSLGCILFELATGRPPFVREGAGELIIAHVTEMPPSARELEPGITPALDDLIARMLRKDPAQRPQSMSEVVSALRACSHPGAAPAPVFAPTPGLGRSQPGLLAAPQTAPSAAARQALPMPCQQSSPVLAGAPTEHPLSRLPRADPTALLSPSENAAETSRPPLPTLLDHCDAPLAAPPDEPSATFAPSVQSPAPRKQRSRSKRVSPGRVSDSMSLLFVGIALLCVLALVVVFVVRQNGKAPSATPAPRPLPREQFKMPAPTEPAPAYEAVEARTPVAPPAELERAHEEPPTDERRAGAVSRPRSRASAASANGTPPRLVPQTSPK